MLSYIRNLFKRRHSHDIDRLEIAYRCFLVVSRTIDEDSSENGDDTSERQYAFQRRSNLAFRKAVEELSGSEPALADFRVFHQHFLLRMIQAKSFDLGWVLAFNDYLNQKQLAKVEIAEVFARCADEVKRTYPGTRFVDWMPKE